MRPARFRAELERLGLSIRPAARLFGVDPRNVRRWAHDEGEGPPRSVALAVLLMVDCGVSPERAGQLLEHGTDRGVDS